LLGLCVALADRGAGRTEESDHLGGSKQDAPNQRDVAKSSGEIVQLASEDPLPAGKDVSTQKRELSTMPE
jgi:hypothetical protein